MREQHASRGLHSRQKNPAVTNGLHPKGGSRRSHGEARCVQNKGNVQHLGIEEVLGEKWAEGLVQHPAYTQPQRWRVTGGLKTLCLGVKKGGWKEVSRPGAGASRHPSRKDSLILLLAFECFWESLETFSFTMSSLEQRVCT
ncbi:hypothetical protein VIGAN_11134000, partial [Vigna angularis var. angularis]